MTQHGEAVTRYPSAEVLINRATSSLAESKG